MELCSRSDTVNKHTMQNSQSPSQTSGPPPGFMTIQVEVPMNLGPSRQLFVYVTPTYPIQLVVPQGIPPGTIIPVYIPIPPAPIYPQGYHHYQPPPPPPPPSR
eukprot:scaffold16150_cov112-Cylindrotheca_fusiformis.AAC.1